MNEDDLPLPTAIPDGITLIVGWRAWRVHEDGIGSINTRPDMRWPVGEPLEAECFHTGSGMVGLRSLVATSVPMMTSTAITYPPPAATYTDPHNEVLNDEALWQLMRGEDPERTVPAKDCTCGIYAVKVINEEVLQYAKSRDYSYTITKSLLGNVLGRVAMWGRTVMHETGWRGQYAYPQAFYVQNEEQRPILERYGVPVLRMSDLDLPMGYESDQIEALRFAHLIRSTLIAPGTVSLFPVKRTRSTFRKYIRRMLGA